MKITKVYTKTGDLGKTSLVGGYRVSKTTYAQAKERTLRRAAVLKQHLPDEAENAVVGIYMDNSLDWIEIFWAVLCCGFRPLLMNLRLSRKQRGDSAVHDHLRRERSALAPFEHPVRPARCILFLHPIYRIFFLNLKPFLIFF